MGLSGWKNAVETCCNLYVKESMKADTGDTYPLILIVQLISDTADDETMARTK